MAKWEVVCDDVLHWAESYTGPKFHAILTDPPYSLGNGERGFMNKAWDNGIAFQPATWAALAAHLLPGAHVLAFGGGRTHHRLMCAIEDAGLEIRDCIYWAFGSGLPKSLSIGKQLDKMAGKEREIVGPKIRPDGKTMIDGRPNNFDGEHEGYDRPWKHDRQAVIRQASITAPATPAAATWEGYGSALKPAVEVIVMARKPLEGTIAGNCERYGSGALNIDGTRIGYQSEQDKDGAIPQGRITTKVGAFAGRSQNGKDAELNRDEWASKQAGRWPANLLLDDSEAVAGLFPQSEVSGSAKNGKLTSRKHTGMGATWDLPDDGGHISPNDSGSAARFFYAAGWELDQAEQLDAADVLRYCAKASRAERDAGLDSLPARDVPYTDYRENAKETKSWVTEYPDGTPRPMSKLRNAHPTVKPLSLCRYLATLLLPPAAYAPRRILVPFAGVSSEMIGAGLAGWDEVIGIEQELEYTQIAEARLAYWLRQPELALR